MAEAFDSAERSAAVPSRGRERHAPRGVRPVRDARLSDDEERRLALHERRPDHRRRRSRRSSRDPGDVQRSQLAAVCTFGATSWHSMVFVNGRFAPELSDLSRLARGVRVRSIASSWEDSEEIASRIATALSTGKSAGKSFASTATGESHAFTALNTAFSARRRADRHRAGTWRSRSPSICSFSRTLLRPKA